MGRTAWRKNGTWSVRRAEDFGRMRLSRSFFMRDFLYSDISNVQGLANLPDDPELAIAAGRGLCENLLEPLQATFGRIAIRGGYRAAAVNRWGNENGIGCSTNERSAARSIWDRRNDYGMGAGASIVIPWMVDRRIGWQAMAWFIHDNLPYSEFKAFPKLSAFFLTWHQVPKRTISSFVPPKGLLTKPGMANHDGDHRALFKGFPKLVRTDKL